VGRKRWSWGTFLKWTACAIAVAFLVRALMQADLPRAVARIGEAGPAVALIVLPFLVSIALDATACRLLFAAIGRRARFEQLLAVRLTAEAVNMSLPAGGVWSESLNPLLLNRRCGIPGSEAVAGMAAKKWLQMRGHGLYIFASVAVGFGFLSSHSRAIVGFDGLPWIVLASGCVPLALSVMLAGSLARGALVEKTHALLRKLPSLRLRAWLDERRHHFVATDSLFGRIATSRTTELAASPLFLASWLIESVETLVILRVLGVPIGFIEVLSFEAGLSLLRNFAFFAPAGLGVQDLGYMAYLGALGYPGAASLGAAFVLLKRAKEIFWIVIGYALFLLVRARATPDGASQSPPPASIEAAP